MICRLIEEEEVGRIDEESSEVRAHDPATGEGAGRGGVVAFLEAESSEDFLCSGLEGVIDLVMMIIFGGIDMPDGDVENAGFASLHNLLREVAKADTTFPRDFATIGFFFAKEDAEEGGFTCAIWADEAHALPSLEMERDAVEKRSRAVGLMEFGEGEHGGGLK